MLGVVASSLVARGGVAVSDLGALDFVNGSYVLGGVSVAIADIIDQPDKIGASGLEITDSQADGVVQITGALLDLLVTADWTLVFEYQQPSGSDRSYLLAMQDEDFNNFFEVLRQLAGGGLKLTAGDGDGGSREVNDHDSHGAGTYKIAVSRTADFIAISVDGGAADTLVSDSALAVTMAAFGGFPSDVESWGPFFLRSLTILAALPAANLPALSAI